MSINDLQVQSPIEDFVSLKTSVVKRHADVCKAAIPNVSRLLNKLDDALRDLQGCVTCIDATWLGIV